MLEPRRSKNQTQSVVAGIAGLAIGAAAGAILSKQDNRKKLQKAFNSMQKKASNIVGTVKKETDEIEEEVIDQLKKKEELRDT